jgi:hypothetical protein
VYAKTRPVKRKRATLESDPPRDTRMGWRRLCVRRGSLRASLAATQPLQDNQSIPPMPCKLMDSRACSPGPKTDIIAEQLAVIIAEQ